MVSLTRAFFTAQTVSAAKANSPGGQQKPGPLIGAVVANFIENDIGMSQGNLLAVRIHRFQDKLTACLRSASGLLQQYLDSLGRTITALWRWAGTSKLWTGKSTPHRSNAPKKRVDE